MLEEQTTGSDIKTQGHEALDSKVNHAFGSQESLSILSALCWSQMSLQGGIFLCRLKLEFHHCVSGTVIYGCVFSVHTLQF